MLPFGIEMGTALIPGGREEPSSGGLRAPQVATVPQHMGQWWPCGNALLHSQEDPLARSHVQVLFNHQGLHFPKFRSTCT